MAVTMLTRALMGSAAPSDEPVPPTGPAPAPAPKPAAKRLTPKDVAQYIFEGTFGSSTATPRTPPQKYNPGGQSSGNSPRPSVSIQQAGGAFSSVDDALQGLRKRVSDGDVVIPGFGSVLGDETRELDFLRNYSAGELSKMRKTRAGGRPERVVPAGTAGAGVVTAGSQAGTQHVVPRFTFNVSPTIDVNQFTRGLPSAIEHIDAFTAGNPKVKSPAAFLSAYGSYAQGDAKGTDPVLKQLSEAYTKNQGNQVAQDAVANVSKAYGMLLRSSQNALQNGWDANALGDAYKVWASSANSLLGAIGKGDTATIKAQTKQFNDGQEYGVLGAIRSDRTKAEFDEVASKTDEPSKMRWLSDKPVPQGDNQAQMIDAVKRAGIKVAVNELLGEFRKPNGGTSPADQAYTAKGNLIEALALHPQSPLSRILEENVSGALSDLNTKNPKMVASLASTLRSQFGGKAGSGQEGANTFDANVAKQLGVPEFLKTNVGLLFGGRAGNATQGANFSRAANLAVKELQRGTNTNWNRVADLMRPYLSSTDFDMILPRSGVSREARVPTGKVDQTGAPIVKTKTEQYSPDVQQTKLYTQAFKDMTGLDLGVTNTGRTNIPNFGKQAFNVIADIKDSNPELYQYLLERTMAAAPGGRTDIGNQKGKGRTKLSVEGSAPAEGPVRPGDAPPTAKTGRNTFSTDVNRPLDLKLANAIWHSITSPVRPNDYVPGSEDMNNGGKHPSVGEMLAKIADSSQTFKNVLAHPTKPTEIGTAVTRGQEQGRIDKATVVKPEGERVTRNDTDRLVTFFTDFDGLHPSTMEGITANKEGTPAQRRLYEIMSNPAKKAAWAEFTALEKKAISALGSDFVEGGSYGQTRVSGSNKNKSTAAINTEMSAIADQLIGNDIKDPEAYRVTKGKLMNYLGSLSDKARTQSGLDVPLLDKFNSMVQRFGATPETFSAFNPVGRVADTKMPGDLTWPEAQRMAGAIEALVRVHGSNQQKELLTRKEGDERQRGHKVLVQLANNPTRVLQIVEDLREKAGMPAKQGPDRPRSNVNRPTEDAALRAGGPRQGKDALWNSVLGAVNTALGVKGPDAIGDKGPQGKAYQEPGVPVRDEPVWQPFMANRGGNSPANATKWYTDWVKWASDTFTPGSQERTLALKLGRDLATGTTVDQAKRKHSDDDNFLPILRRAKIDGFPVDSVKTSGTGRTRSLVKAGKVLSVGGLITGGAMTGRQGVRNTR